MTARLLGSLTEPERMRWHTATTPRLTRYVSEVPHAKQAAFLLLDQREAFYGGAAGPGKSSALLMGALQYVDVPGYAALLLRRTYKQLAMPGALISRAHEWLDGTDARWHEGQKRWTFPSTATLTFGYLGRDKESRRQFESAEFNYIAVDELTAFDEDEYRFLFSRLRRRGGFPVPSRMRSASNPGGRGHTWVKTRFVDERTRLRRAVFLPARIGDNPSIDRADYVQSLRELHPTTWRRLLAGDWEAGDPGEMFQPRIWLTADDFLDAPPARAAARVRYWDLAAAEPTSHNPDPDYTVGVKMSRLHDGTYVVEHAVRLRGTPGATERAVASTAVTDGPECVQWLEQVPGAGAALVDHFKRNVCPEGIRMRGNPVRGSKAVRALPLAAEMEKHRVRFVRGTWNEPLFDEMEAFSEDPQHSGAHDDQVDAASGSFERLRLRTVQGTMSSAPQLVAATLPTR